MVGSGVGGGVSSRFGAGRRAGGALRAGGGRRRPESFLGGGSCTSGLLNTSSSSEDCAEICGDDMPVSLSRLDGRGGGRLDPEGLGGARLPPDGFGGARLVVGFVSYSDSCSEICGRGAGFRGAGLLTGEIGCGREGAALLLLVLLLLIGF